MNKREKKSIIIWLALAIVIFIWFTIIILTYIFPWINEIEKQKQLYKTRVQLLNNLEKLWFSFDEYKSYQKEHKDNTEFLANDSYNRMIKNLDDNFYKDTLSWAINSNNLFMNKLQEINNNILLKKQSWDYKRKKESLSKILPKYSPYTNTKDFLSDLKFINYLENLLNKYSITTNSEIWIKNLVLEKNTKNIYYIPIYLEVLATKWNILKFLNEIKLSWSVSFKDNEIKINNNNQLSEVEQLFFKDYISIPNKSKNKTEWLYEFLDRTNQSWDYIKAKITLKFYVNWVWKDFIIKEINKIVGNIKTEILYDKDWKILKDENWKIKRKLVNYNYYNLLYIVKKLNSNPEINKNNYLKNKLLTIYNYLNDDNLKKDLKNIKKEMIKSKNLDPIYKKALKYKEIFSKLDKELYEIVKSADLENILPKAYYKQK